jgi:hypothetical protein
VKLAHGLPPVSVCVTLPSLIAAFEVHVTSGHRIAATSSMADRIVSGGRDA